MTYQKAQDRRFVSFDDIMERLLEERSCYDDVEEQPPNTPFLQWDDDYWKWLHNKRYDICLISEDASSDMGTQEWSKQKGGIVGSINKQFYAITPVGAAALIADALGMWNPAMSTIIGEDRPQGIAGTEPYVLCVPPEALRWYPELEQDLAGIGMRCAFDAREHKDMRWFWADDESNIEMRLRQPSSRRVFAMGGDDDASVGLPERQHRGFSVRADDEIEKMGDARCPACGERGGVMRRVTDRFGARREMHLSCGKCEWMGKWLELGVADRIVTEAILDDDEQELVLHEWEASSDARNQSSEDKPR